MYTTSKYDFIILFIVIYTTRIIRGGREAVQRHHDPRNSNFVRDLYATDVFLIDGKIARDVFATSE